MPNDPQGFPIGRALLALAGGALLGGLFSSVAGLSSLVALNGFSEREALPILALVGALCAGATGFVTSLLGLLALGAAPGGGRRWGGALLLGLLLGGAELFAILLLLALFA